MSRVSIPVGWRPTHAHLRAVLVALGGSLAGLLAGLPELVLLTAPLALVAAWGAAGRPSGRPAAQLRLSEEVVREDGTATAVTEVRGLAGADAVSSQIPPAPGTSRRPEHGARTVALSRPERRDGVALVTGADPVRWGVHQVGPGAAGALGVWGSWVWGPAPLDARTLRAVPAPEAFDAAASAPHPRGLIGRHRSVRPGEGAEFDTVRPFRWGDRLRRIHWARSSRSAELHVTSSSADQDTHIALLLDAQRDIVPPHPAGTAPSSTLDRAVRSAAALGEHFAREGDRVSLQVLPTGPLGRVPPGTGARQARRILDVLSLVAPAAEREVDVARLRLGLAPGTLVVLVSPLLTASAGLRAAALARSGMTVLLVDVLGGGPEESPAPEEGPAAAPEEVDPGLHLAWRIRMIERAEEISRLRRAGVAVVPWQGAGSLDAVLRMLVRRGSRSSVGASG